MRKSVDKKKRTKNINSYDANSIKVLKGLESIRRRPDMYIGSTTGAYSNGLYRLVREALDNSIDEYLAKKCNKIDIIYDPSVHRVTVIDNGRGIPVGINDETGKNSLTLLFTEIHAGGKFFNEKEDSSYKTSSGRNGVGQKAISALSSELTVWSSNTGTSKWATQSFRRGIVASEVKFIKSSDVSIGDIPIDVPNSGSIVSWIPDPDIFKDGIQLHLDRLIKELKDIQYLCPGLKINFTVINGSRDEWAGTYYSESGLSELVASLADDPEATIFSYSDEVVDAAIAFSNKEGNQFRSFVNVINTDLGGTHLDGFKKIIADTFKSKSKLSIHTEDIFEGIRGAIHYKSSDPQYQSQTKNELTSSDATEVVIDRLRKPLAKFFKDHTDLFYKILKYAEEMYQKRVKLKADKALLKGVKKLSGSKYISEKFSDADRRKYPDTSSLELFIVEGDSAGGHFKQARDGFQACLKLRGKVINAMKATHEELFGSSKRGDKSIKGNREIQDLVGALGCGVLDHYSEENLRFGKLIIMTDADPDGLHITNLILAFLAKYIPQLIRDGHVYAIDSPLFLMDATTAKGEILRFYGNSRQEVENQAKAHGDIKHYTITRMKGWGECNASDLQTLCISKEHRKLIRIDLHDGYQESLNNTMGSDTAYRKDMLLIDQGIQYVQQ